MPLGAVPFPFGICRICRDKATGLHYGVATCEGCKGFFKRTVSKQEKLKCYFNGSCDVNPKTRSQCKACRFKRCLETGMSVDGVRMGRIPKIEKDKVLEAFHDGGSHFSNHELLVQQTGEGSYKFVLNKTDATTNATCTTSQNLNTDSTCGVATATENYNSVRYEQKGQRKEGTSSSIYLTPEPPSVSANGITETFKEHTISSKCCNSTNVNIDLSRGNIPRPMITEAVNAQDIFMGVCGKPGEEFPLLSQMETRGTKGAVQNEKCDNPFSDKDVNKEQSYSKEHFQRIPPAQQQCLNDPRLAQNAAESFHKVGCIESVPSSFENPSREYDTVLPYNEKSATSINGTSRCSQLSNHFKTCQYSMVNEREQKENYRDGDTGCTESIHTAPLPTEEQNDSSGMEEEQVSRGRRRRASFTPALINVLLEQVLDSQESVNIFADKIQQNHQQGNFSQLFAENLSQHVSKVPAKRQRYTDGTVTSFPPENDCRETDSLYDCMYHSNESSHNRQGYCDIDTSRKCSSMTITNPRRGKAYGTETSVNNGSVSSSSLSSEEEGKVQEIRNTLDGINIALKILHRLKPEHREKIRQHKLGKIHLRVMTDSEEDVKETYEKLISGIPNLNERILGFCNNVPGFSDIEKADQDVIMKRAYYDIWMICYSEYLHGNESYMILESGEIYSQQVMRKILNDDMVDKLFEFANQFNSLELSDVETAVLCAARLTSTDGLELTNRQQVNTLHSHMLDVLAYEVKLNHGISYGRKLIDIFRLMPLLETVNRIQRDIIAKFSV